MSDVININRVTFQELFLFFLSAPDEKPVFYIITY